MIIEKIKEIVVNVIEEKKERKVGEENIKKGMGVDWMKIGLRKLG